MRMDCLAAGTLVWTDAGPAPIEQIRVGDLVLAQDPESGELAYQPVLRTPIRPQGPLVRVCLVNREVLETSGGHLFWVAGAGWTKARELRSGCELHGVTGAVRVSLAETSSEAETYNLIVADFSGVSGDAWAPKVRIIELTCDHHRPSGEWLDRWTAGSPLIWNGAFYGIDQYGVFYAVDLASGKTLYKQDVGFDEMHTYVHIGVGASVSLPASILE